MLPPISRQTLTAQDMSPENLTAEQYSAWNTYITPEEREEWKKRLETAHVAMFTPLSLTHETVSMPGSTGGTNLGNTASNPGKGIVYVMSQSYPSIYPKLQTREGILKDEAGLMGEGVSTYSKNCQTCHGADRAGLVGPSLLKLGSRLNFNDFTNVVLSGKGEMPAFSHLNENNLKNLYKYLNAGNTGNNKANDDKNAMPAGPVVASGGAPGGLELRKVLAGGGRFGAPYPVVDTPANRYFIDGYGLGFPYLIPPPWSEIMAYDLNKGTLKWRVPLGKTEQGENTGLPRGSQRNGMIVTSTGIVFSTARDRKIYAFDADNGKELWAGNLPADTEGLPSMYQVNGRYYIVVSATIPPAYWGRQPKGTGNDAKNSAGKKGYVVFALPKKQ
jgi:quinoprotein glucose dehydrogenase